MSDIINLLPDSVANQIAAGEVVQRPASVVKELLENSIDAGASAIQLNAFDAGKAGIQVVDNGQGMSHTDARLCFERHATSKIHEAYDLSAIATMGFRGEALASIAAVAEVTLITRRAEDEMGTQVTLAASKILDHTPVAAPVGTNFFVRNLFFNVPARRRFLKSTSVELKHIVSEFQRVALANPQVAMRLSHDSAVLYDLHVSNRKERILALFGQKLEKNLLPITVHTDLVDIEGFIGTPKAAKRRAGEQFLFVNARFMRNPALNRAIYAAFEKLIATDMMPIFFVFFTVDPATIDVNIHPQKTEIKFENDQVIWQLLHSAVREVLGKHSGMPQIDFSTPPLTSSSFFPPSSFFSISEQERTESASALADAPWRMPNTAKPTGDEGMRRAIPSQMNSLSQPPSLSSQAALSKAFQLADHYIVTPMGEGLVAIVDQHRAHARILYEQLCAAAPQHGVSQRLAMPISIPLNATQRAVLQDFIPEAQKLGFAVQQQDATSTLSLLAIPHWLSPDKCADLVVEMLDTDHSTNESAHAEAHDAYLKHLAFAAAIGRSQSLAEQQLQTLLHELFACHAPAIDPLGSPTYILLNEDGVKDLFASAASK